jgi:hypothetical protein
MVYIYLFLMSALNGIEYSVSHPVTVAWDDHPPPPLNRRLERLHGVPNVFSNIRSLIFVAW